MRPDAFAVPMTMTEVYMAVSLGAFRRTSSWREGYNSSKHTSNPTDWAWDIEGALAEMALAKLLNVYYLPTNKDGKKPDVAGNQVRSTDLKTGGMFFRENDIPNKDQPFVLAIVEKHLVNLIGWLYGRDCMKEEWRFGRPDEVCWLVPQRNVNRSMAELIKT